ncbi:PEGA domain-containing protein [Spirosoma soli]|uniref:PEGA domain-containing protein n=1 Tax=Spirosoma soli TaxID=1770529 RepID=A0ABW5MBC2_9BACT
MKPLKTRLLPLALAALILLESCASSTVIQSNPSGAKVYLNSSLVGTTPYTHTDTKIVGSTTFVRLEKEGYQQLNSSFSRDEKADAGAIIGGFFLLFPFLWTMKYNPSRTYELVPMAGTDSPGVATMPLANDQSVSSSKAVRLRDLKKLLDDGILTKDEYEKEKKKILDSEN